MQQNDCYLSQKQKELLSLLASSIQDGTIDSYYEAQEDNVLPTKLSYSGLDYMDLLAFIDCGFVSKKRQLKTGYDSDYGYGEYIYPQIIYKFDINKILDGTNNMNQSINYNGLTEEHWNFLVLLKNAIKGKYLTQKSKTTYYIRPIEEDGKIVNFDGFTSIFLNGHRNELCVPLKVFLDLASMGYLEKARYGHYHIKDKKILADVDDYLAQRTEQKTTPVTNSSSFRLPDTSAQFQCDIFMVMPFRADLKPIYDDHIKLLAKNLGYEIKRGDDTFSKHDILTEIWSLINNAKLIIADCTGKNANVFYELGLAHAIDKPVIIITQNEEDIPFDIRQRRYIKYEYTPRGMKQFEEDLRKAIQSILGS